METTEKIWLNGSLLSWEKAQTHALTHTLHYGAGAFEGLRFYATPKGAALFRLREHTERLFYSASAIGMDVPYSVGEIDRAIVETVAATGVSSGYVRPICYFGYGKMGLNPDGSPVDVCIAAWPWGKYLEEDAVRVKTSRYIRIHPRSVISDAKVCGYYVNSILASIEIKKGGYDEALLLDYRGNVAEGPGENIFWIKDGCLFTVPPGNILLGITRDSIMTIARRMGLEVEERDITLEELKEADEVFFTGTAAEVTGIASIDDAPVGGGVLGEVTARLRDAYMKTVGGEDPEYEHWLTYINS